MENVTIEICYTDGESILPQNVVVKKNGKVVSGLQKLRLVADLANGVELLM